MATVTSVTAAKAQAIEDASVVSGAINSGTGHLILTTAGGTQIDAGIAKDSAGTAAAVLVETNNRISADAAHAAAGDPHPVYMTAAEVTAAINAAVVPSAWTTSTTGFNIVGTWISLSVNYRTLTIGTWSLVDLYFECTRNGADITNPASGNSTNTTIFSAIPAAIRPTQMTIGGGGPGRGTVGATGGGRIIAVALQTDGTADIIALGGSSDLINGETISARMVYMR